MSRKLIIVITGASGFVGKKFLNLLKFKKLNNVRVFATFNKKKIFIKSKYINFSKINLIYKNKTKNFFLRTKPDFIFHLAGLKNPAFNEKYKMKAYNTNYVITKNILDSIDKKKSKIVFLSTDKVYENNKSSSKESFFCQPSGIYAKLKLRSEKLIKKKIKNYLILRIPIIHDNGNYLKDSFIDKALFQIKKKQKVKIASNVYRSFVKVDQLAEFLFSLTNKPFKAGIFNVGSKCMSYYDRIKYLCNINKFYYKNLINKVNLNVKPLVQNLSKQKYSKNFKYKFN